MVQRGSGRFSQGETRTRTGALSKQKLKDGWLGLAGG